MERVYVRTCSADQATALATADGRCARIGKSQVRIYRPAGREPINPSSSSRYLARVEILDADECPTPMAGQDAEAVVSELFGQYLN